jgi:choloylglycine hydrolase
MEKKLLTCLIAAIITIMGSAPAYACTGITLQAKDGATVFARTLEWGAFDIHSRLVIVPRGYQFTSQLEDGKKGAVWKGRYGAVGVDAVEKDNLVDGLNEKGLSVNAFYHPSVAEYPKADSDNIYNSIGPLDVAQYLLTTSANVEEAKAALSKVTVVSVTEPAIGVASPFHFIVTEPSGKAIVIEFADQEVQIFDAPLGVITNAPEYDWHITNLRNYVNLSPVALPGKKIDELDFTPLGAGSGMIGLPGDFTPASRFVRAVAFSKTARPTDSGTETMYEAFRILDSFNVPLEVAEGEGEAAPEGMRSATIWTTAYDTKNLIMQYHTMNNRRVRQVDLKNIDFSSGKKLVQVPLDKTKEQDIQDVTPRH